MDRNKIIKLLVILAAIVVFVGSVSKLVNGNSMSLSEYAASKNPQGAENSSLEASEPSDASDTAESYQPLAPSDLVEVSPAPECSLPTPSPSPEPVEVVSNLVGATLNGSSVLEQRYEYAESFYYEPLSENLRRYMTGVSYPAEADTISFDELRYVHILHYDFEGNPVEGELICNQAIAQDLVEIFYELYQNEYQLASVLLIDEFDGNLNASAEANNSFCFYASTEEQEGTMEKHGLGLAVDINPLYNPQVSYAEDGTVRITPEASANYAERSGSFPYKIDENDLCYKLFLKHGFVWGGNRNNEKSYGHFHKNLP